MVDCQLPTSITDKQLSLVIIIAKSNLAKAILFICYGFYLFYQKKSNLFLLGIIFLLQYLFLDVYFTVESNEDVIESIFIEK